VSRSKLADYSKLQFLACRKGSGEEANDVFLAVAPEFSETQRGRRFRVEVPLYRWQGGYFDYVSSVTATNPQSITFFNIFSHDYLAIANFQDGTGKRYEEYNIFMVKLTDNLSILSKVQRTFTRKYSDITIKNLDSCPFKDFVQVELRTLNISPFETDNGKNTSWL
jgi:hypothetical protein